MLACVFGCDALFEAGFSVNENGKIATSSFEPEHEAIAKKLIDLDGRPVGAHTDESTTYFTWHYSNVFRGSNSNA